MRWRWPLSDWPDFRHDERPVENRQFEFCLKSERLTGCFAVLPVESQKDATMYLMLSEAIKTRAIEGDELDRESVRSSLLSWMTSETLSDNPDQKATGAAALLVSVRQHWQASLTYDWLGEWQSMAVPEQRCTDILRGPYRNDRSAHAGREWSVRSTNCALYSSASDPSARRHGAVQELVQPALPNA